MPFKQNPAVYSTITCLNWHPFLQPDACKRLVIDAMVYRVMQQEIKIYGFVIMPNHLHLIWKIADDILLTDFQRDFLKFTATNILTYLKSHEPELYDVAKVNAADRQFQVWERNSLHKEILSEAFLIQKLEYIHNNPLQPKWNLVSLPEQYEWSSASFYLANESKWKFLTHYNE